MAVNPIDRLIGFFDPSRGLKRVVDRTRLALATRAYEAASPRDTWRPRRAGASAQADHMADAATLRTKARALVQNVPYIAASLDALVANVIGTGIVPRFTGAQAEALNSLFTRWSKVCDADNRLDFFGLQGVAYRAMEQDGEVLVRLRPRRPQDNLPVPLQLQLLEIDWLDSSRNTGNTGSPAGVPQGNVIVEGIEYDPMGKVAAYWLWDQHPGDITLRRGLRSQSSRVDAQFIVHLFDPKRPGQGRGISRLAPVIARTRDTQLYEDAELARKNLEARLSVLVSGDAALMANDFQTTAGTTAGADTATARRTGDLGELASGSITEIPAGNTVTTVEPKPAGGHVEYVKWQMHVITAALGVTYEMATGDMTEVNFSSARVRSIDVRRGFEHTQWVVLIPRLLQAILDAMANAAVLAGKVPASRYGIEYDCPKWDYVNPAQEAQADVLQINSGLASLSSKLRARGENPAKVFEEIAADFKRLKELGVLDTLVFLQKGKTEATDQAATDAAAVQEAAARHLESQLQTGIDAMREERNAEASQQSEKQSQFQSLITEVLRNQLAAAQLKPALEAEPPPEEKRTPAQIDFLEDEFGKVVGARQGSMEIKFIENEAGRLVGAIME